MKTHTQRRSKTFTGCKRCRQRKIRCDETRPGCLRCRKSKFDCPGYGIELIWTASNGQVSHAQGLYGRLPPELWETKDRLDHDEVDEVITQLSNFGVMHFDRCRHNSKRLGPFSVMSFASEYIDHSKTFLFNYSPSTSSPIVDGTGRYLFYHYVNIVSSRMMPFEDRRNPWKCYYPSLALSNSSFAHIATRHAILSQAAAHLQHLECDPVRMEVLALDHYSKALRALSHYRRNSSDDDFGTVIACILSLMMAEVYMGVSAAWRVHLTSAWRLALQALPSQPWKSSEMTWLATQSLCFVKMRMSISDQNHPDTRMSGPCDFVERKSTDEPEFELLIKSVSYRNDFGFTLGASASSAAGLFRALRLIGDSRDTQDISQLRRNVRILTEKLLSSIGSEGGLERSFSQLHSHIFTLGVIIFLNRQTIDPSPYELLPYVQSLFKAVREFEHLCYKTPTQSIRRSVADITLWPIFVAAVECFREEEMEIAKGWMQSVIASGIGNRKDVISVVMKVWETREELRQTRALDLHVGCNWYRSNEPHNLNYHEVERGLTRVSWQEAMRSQGVDLLLI